MALLDEPWHLHDARQRGGVDVTTAHTDEAVDAYVEVFLEVARELTD
jgi:hypothetical protein